MNSGSKQALINLCECLQQLARNIKKEHPELLQNVELEECAGGLAYCLEHDETILEVR